MATANVARRSVVKGPSPGWLELGASEQDRRGIWDGDRHSRWFEESREGRRWLRETEGGQRRRSAHLEQGAVHGVLRRRVGENVETTVVRVCESPEQNSIAVSLTEPSLGLLTTLG